jgi:bacterioferritin (cytochrome b1)
VACGEVKNCSTRDILAEILNDEDAHIEDVEDLPVQIEQRELSDLLTTQILVWGAIFYVRIVKMAAFFVSA